MASRVANRSAKTTGTAKQIYDVFLSHNSSDKPAVEKLAGKLKNAGVTPWLDTWNLIPGRPWQSAIEEALEKCLTCAVFLGPKGTGPWQVEEMRAAIDRRVTDTKGSFRVIPVMLPGAKKKQPLPKFLTSTTWVIFRRTIEDKKAFHRLLSGIRDSPPGDLKSKQSKNSEPSGRVEVLIKVSGDAEVFRRVTLAAQDFLQKLLGDPSLTIKYIGAGSVLIKLECSFSALQRLSELYSTGKLTEILGYRIETLTWNLSDESSSPKATAPKKATPLNSFLGEKIIILAHERDDHAAPVKWALEQAGYRVASWGGLSYTAQQQASLLLDEQPSVALGPYSVEPGDAVWIRRPDQPVPNPKVSEADRKFAELEYRSFFHCVAYTLETLPVWCINRYSASRFVNNISVQLRLARSCGLRVPKALLSNSPTGVRDFFKHTANRIICKGFSPHVWQREGQGGVAVTETFELQREQLPEDEVLTYAPGIYQDMVVKQFDICMLLMGHRVYSYALHDTLKALDWRQDAEQGKIEVEIVPTPPDVEKGVLAFAEKAGICFGLLDFAVDIQGQWWFLEINEQGQFLWLDQFNKQARTQEKFCAFITTPEGSTQPLEEREGLFPSFVEYEKSAEAQQTQSFASIETRPFHPPIEIKNR